MFKRLIAVGFCLALVAGGSALAEPQTPAPNERAVPVRYTDLDLSQRADAEALLSRLRYAAMRACEVNAVSRPGPRLRRAIEECRTAALDDAVDDAGSTELSQLHSEQRR